MFSCYTEKSEAPVAKWLRPLLLALLITRHLTAVGSSLAWVTCETSQILFAGGQVFFLGVSPIFAPPNDWLGLEWVK